MATPSLHCLCVRSDGNRETGATIQAISAHFSKISTTALAPLAAPKVFKIRAVWRHRHRSSARPSGIGRVGDPQLTADGMAWVASLDDLLATKLKVILQGAEAKDYSDIQPCSAAPLQSWRGWGIAWRLD